VGADLVDEFTDVEQWRANNPRAPAEFSSDGEALTLTDPPGGEVTWGTSIYRDVGQIDLDATPFFVAKVVEATGGFSITLINRDTSEKRGGLAALKEPGLAVMHVPDALGWAGTVPLSLGLYVRGTEKTVRVDWIKFAGQLTREEKRAMSRVAVSRPKALHGLTELAKRQGWRRLEHTQRGDSYLSERTVFRDTATGCIAWRMTCDPAVDQNDYYDIPGWNADGSIMGFLTRRAGGKTRWLMDADGSNLRPMLTAEGRPIGGGYWSVIYPDRYYHAIKDENGTHVAATNPWTGERQSIVSVNRNLGAMMPPHPSEEWFLFGGRTGGVQDPSTAYVVGLDGSVEEAQFEKRWHRLRFTRAADRRIFFNFDDPRTQWTILPGGAERASIPYTGGHPDWLPDGSELTYYAEGTIWGVRPDGTDRRVVMELSSGGHGGPCADGEWFVSDTPGGGKYPGSILYLRTDGSQVCHPVFRHMSSYYSHSVTWHPDHHSSHPHPNSSPDGTKTIFNTDFLAEYTDIYIAINRFPDPPRELGARVAGGSVVLTWQEPERCRETRGYHVYRASESGTGYERLTAEPATDTQWRGPAQEPPGYYVVTAVEHSGLESRSSGEAFQSGNDNWQGPVRLALEAEAGRGTLPMREFSDQRTASHGYYVACLGEEAGGSLPVEAVVPKGAEYRLWARVRGNGALSVTGDGDTWGSLSCGGDEWTWEKIDATAGLTRGRHVLTLTPTSGQECVDKLLLTDDMAFVPGGPMPLDATPPETPRDLEVVAVSANTLKLSWSNARESDVDHYNVYCGSEPDFACEQASLVGSPSQAELVDWGLALNTTYWYKATAVDRAGNESAPSEAVRGSTPAFEPVRIALKPEGATAEAMRVESVDGAGGNVLRPMEGGRSRAVWEFDVPRDGEYAIWGRSTHREKQSAAFDIAIGRADGPGIAGSSQPIQVPWRVFGRWEQWTWSPAGSMITGSPELFALKAGKHTLRLRPRTESSQVAELVITDDPSWWPVEGMRK
jgi:hypothetical protein